MVDMQTKDKSRKQWQQQNLQPMAHSVRINVNTDMHATLVE